MKLEEVIKYIRQGKRISRDNGSSIKFNCESEMFETNFVLKKEDLFADDWKVEGLD